jgi:hypothetical protein
MRKLRRKIDYWLEPNGESEFDDDIEEMTEENKTKIIKNLKIIAGNKTKIKKKLSNLLGIVD